MLLDQIKNKVEPENNTRCQTCCVTKKSVTECCGLKSKKKLNVTCIVTIDILLFNQITFINVNTHVYLNTKARWTCIQPGMLQGDYRACRGPQGSIPLDTHASSCTAAGRETSSVNRQTDE